MEERRWELRATQYADWKTPLDGMFPRKRLIDILKNFILFSEDAKILAGYHQYFAVNKALESVHEAIGGDGRAASSGTRGGSGQVAFNGFLAHLLEKLDSPTIVVITDRNDLDSQLFAQFSRCSDFCARRPFRRRAAPMLCAANLEPPRQRHHFHHCAEIPERRPSPSPERRTPSS